MISIPAAYIMGAYALAFLVIVGLFFIHLFQGFRYGRHDPLTMGVNSFFVLATAAVIIVTVMLLWPVDWTGSFDLSVPSLEGPSIIFPDDASTGQEGGLE